MDRKIYNLLVSGGRDTWESDSAIMKYDRCFEYTHKEITETFKDFTEDDISKIKSAPCIFAYEDIINKDAYVGYITDIRKDFKNVDIKFKKDGELSSNLMHELGTKLRIDDFEFCRTHWAIKEVDLESVLSPYGISLTMINKRELVDIETHYFDIAFSFAGESRYLVQPIVLEIEKILGENHVFYDNNFISQLARPSLDTLLQGIYRNRSKLIVVVICEKYSEKKWCGLEFRAVTEKIMKDEKEKIMFIRLDNSNVDGIFETDGYIDGTKYSTKKLAEFVCERLEIM